MAFLLICVSRCQCILLIVRSDGNIEELHSKIGLTQVAFEGEVKLKDDGGFEMDASEYVGHPSKEVDLAWDKLLSGQSCGHFSLPVC